MWLVQLLGTEFKLYLTLINLNLSRHMWLVATVLESPYLADLDYKTHKIAIKWTAF